jgi:hypothetical protein
MRISFFISLTLIGLGLNGLYAQVTMPVSGGVASGSGGSIAFSVGQLTYTTNTGSTGVVSQGVQQSYEIWITTESIEGKQITLSVSAFPNPTTDYLKLNIEAGEHPELIYQLSDLNAKILENAIINGPEALIEMNKYAPSVYFLRVIKGDIIIKTFKIIKN